MLYSVMVFKSIKPNVITLKGKQPKILYVYNLLIELVIFIEQFARVIFNKQAIAFE